MLCHVIIGVIFNSNNFIAVFSDSFGRFFILVIAMVAAVTLSFTCFANMFPWACMVKFVNFRLNSKKAIEMVWTPP